MNNKRFPPKVNIGARIPADWAEEFKELATSLHCRQTELFTEALGLYLGKQIDTIVNRVTALEKERVNDNTTVEPGIRDEVIEKLKKEIRQTFIKETTEIKNTIANLSHQINNIHTLPATDQITLVDTGVRDELLKKLEQVIEINQTLIKENAEIKNTIANLSDQINNIKQQPPIEKMTLVESISADKFTGGITQTELCERFGINPGSVNGFAKKAGKSTKEYLEDLTKWRCLVRPGGQKGRWHPPDE